MNCSSCKYCDKDYNEFGEKYFYCSRFDKITDPKYSKCNQGRKK